MSYAPEIPEDPAEDLNNNLLDFDKILEDQGLNINEILEENKSEAKQSPTIFNPNTIMQLLEKNQIADLNPEEISNLIAGLIPEPALDDNNTSENEMAPMGAIVDEENPVLETPTVGISEAERKEIAFRKSLVEASSASEDERGLNNRRNQYLSSDEEMILTNKEAIQKANLREQEKINNSGMLKHWKVIPAKDPVPNSSVSNGGISDPRVKSTSTNSGLILQIPGLWSPSQNHSIKEPVHKIDENMKPDSLLFKKIDPEEHRNEEKGQAMHTYFNLPKTAVERAPQKINYRGVYIQAGTHSDEEANSEDEKQFFNYQREMLKKKLKEQNNTEFGEVDKLNMENVGVEIVNNNKLVKVERDWGTSMSNFDTYKSKTYTEDNE